MSSSHLSPVDLPSAFAEADSLVREAASLLVLAERALDAGDADELLALIQKRSSVLQACEAPLSILQQAASAEPASDAARLFLDRVIVGCEGLQDGENRLALSLESERDRVARELDQIEGDELVRSAYGKQVREQGKINTMG